MKLRVLLIVLFFLIGVLFSAGAERIAVLDSLVDEGVDGSVQVPVTEKLIEVFVGRTDYTVIDRTDVRSVLEEKNFQLSGMVKTEEIREVGQYLGADLICLAKVSLVGRTYFLSVKMIDVENGTIIGQATDESQGSVEVVLRLAESAALKLLEGNGSLAKSDRATKKSTEKKQDNTVFLFPILPSTGQDAQDSGDTATGKKTPARNKLFDTGDVPAVIMLGFSVPVFIGQAYDKIQERLDSDYGTDYERWGVGLRVRYFQPIGPTIYLYADAANSVDYIDTVSGESLTNIAATEFIVGTGYYTSFNEKAFGYFGAGIGFMGVMFDGDVVTWDGVESESNSDISYGIELGAGYRAGERLVIDFRGSLSSVKVDIPDSFGFNSPIGFGALNFSLNAGMTF